MSNEDLLAEGEISQDIEKRVRKLAEETRHLALHDVYSEEIEEETEHVEISVKPSKHSIKEVSKLVRDLQADYQSHEVVVGSNALSDVVYIYLKEDEVKA